MTIVLTGFRTAESIASYLGKKVAVKVSENVYDIYPLLFAIFANRTAIVQDKDGTELVVKWDELENPYILLQQDVEITIK
jgi:hypothetical protein